MLRRNCEGGSAPVELALGVALVLLPAALMVLSFGPWLEARAFVRSGAAAAARQIAVTGSEEGVAPGLAAMANASGVDAGTVALALCGGLPTFLEEPASSTCLPLPRVGVVTVTVSAVVPAFVTPWGDVGGLTVAATHTESLDHFRSMP